MRQFLFARVVVTEKSRGRNSITSILSFGKIRLIGLSKSMRLLVL